jgi:hypothetical protein
MPDENSTTLMNEFLPNAGRLAKSLTDCAGAAVFEFMPEERFQLLTTSDPAEAARVYWREILYRAHLAAVTALARHARWIAACLQHYGAEPNYLGFACCFRGLLEAAADTFYSLRGVPLTIASSIELVQRAIRGQLDTGAYIAGEIEQLLIHFLYARRLDRASPIAPGHKAETAAAYVQCLIDQNDDSVRRMYEELCGLTHPAAASVAWMLKTSPDLALLQFGGAEDGRCVRELVDRHSRAIKTVAAIPLDISVCTLRVLNRLPLREVHIPLSEAYEPAGWDRVLSLLRPTGAAPAK